MKLFFLVAVTMTAFAANSVLNRVGVATFGMDPFVFAVIRVAAGATMLAVLVTLRGQSPFVDLPNRWRGALALTVYMIGFSWAYLSLGAGLGALILFGILQMMMFGWAVFKRQPVPVMRWVGAAFALVGLAVLLWPSGPAMVPFAGTLAMIAATAGWAAYTILGQGVRDPLAVSAGNFILCLPLVALSLLLASGGVLSVGGVAAAIVAGAVTSGMGYALWYRVLPELPTTVAAVAQLSVPVIAVLAGVIFLAEPVSVRLIAAGVLVLGGIAVSNVRWVPARHI
jgi:drug/metabolite transporter (DMT)-like permease|tara:strand:- start:368 stop:1216 length:849 start_codon:yes stop_codon:yes gene_type:complete